LKNKNKNIGKNSSDISAPCGSTKQDKSMKQNSHQAAMELFFFFVRVLHLA